jgi:hypothetical protein
MVVEQPPKGLGTINDMWFSWIIDIGFPGPDRGERGKYLLVPPGYDGLLPEGDFYIALSRTTRALYAARSFLGDSDPRPAVELITKTIKFYPYTPGGEGTSIATALQGKVRLERNPAIAETKFVEASGKVMNTIPPGRLRLLRNDQRERPTGAGNELRCGTGRATGRHRIVKGKPFRPDARMKKVLADAAAVGNAAGPRAQLAVRRPRIPTGHTIPTRCGAACFGKAAPSSRHRRHCLPKKGCSNRCRPPARARSTRAPRSTTPTRWIRPA